ncbi:MAG: ABC transporter permease [Rhodothermales bacterium]|nr:ABC transporter permease [Rhodothermales bacterium]MBO6778986.1 ABC transporter permease [Rhodothermales bacterium]
MNRTFIVAKNEFLTRVKSKAFIITTLLGPIILIGFFAVVGLVTVQSMEGTQRTVSVVDETGLLYDRLEARESDSYRFVEATEPADSVRADVLRGSIDGYLVIPSGILDGAGEVEYFTVDGGIGSVFQRGLERAVEGVVEDARLDRAQITPEVREILNNRVRVNTVMLTSEGEEAGDAGAYAIIGFILGFLIYMAMLIYGSVVMRGVIAEKSTRVVEIIVSSVRPFELLMGKVLGIGAMGVVQMVVWAGMMAAGTIGAGAIVALFADPASLNLPDTATQEEVLAAVDFQPPQLNPEVFIWFVLFFLVGYLLYASLFAAIGSAVEHEQEAQGFLIPVMMPIIISIMFISPIVEEPNSTLALVLSMLPFFSPVPMVVRVAVTDVPLWQVGGSFLLMVGAFLGAIWLSARIYRVGVLMYGKKPSIKDIMKWIRYA